MPEFHFKDNREAMNVMLAKPNGILAIIEEQTRAGAVELDNLAGKHTYIILKYFNSDWNFLILKKILGRGSIQNALS